MSKTEQMKRLAKEIEQHTVREKRLLEMLRDLRGTRVLVTHPNFTSIEMYESLKDSHPDQYQKVVDAAPWPWNGVISTFSLPISAGLGGNIYVTPDDAIAIGKFWSQRMRGGQIACYADWLTAN